MDSLAFTSLNDLRLQLVRCEVGGLVRHKMVHGKVVCKNSRISCVDEASVSHETRESMVGYFAKLAASRVEATRLEPN